MDKKKKKIMIVEDESFTSLLLQKYLKYNGHEVAKITSTGEEAIEYIKSFPVDVVIMDITLAGQINGIEASTQINSIIETTIIFTTGYEGDDIKMEAMKLNPKGYFIKPYSIEDLVCIINDI